MWTGGFGYARCDGLPISMSDISYQVLSFIFYFEGLSFGSVWLS